MLRRIRAQAICLVAVFLIIGCKGDGGLGPGDDASLPETHPPAVGPASFFTTPVWSANGHLAYVLGDYATAVSRLNGTGPARILHTVTLPRA